MIGETVSHYRILERLGEGGMGVVYLAEDTTLRRRVALKFLPSDSLADSEARERLVREAQAAARILHPNICPVYEIAESEGRTFIAMAHLEGQTLRERLARGVVPLDEALSITRQIGEGLAAAHAKGIIHRDIKPANVMLTAEGRAVLMDFGLAKVANATRLTRTGTTLGTAAYMAPEQALGKTPDHRADLWALGVVLYELVTGRLPFRGEHEAALTYAIMHRGPEPPTGVVLPPGLEGVLVKALEKDPAKRYQRANELVADLEAIAKNRDALPAGKRPLGKRHRWLMAATVLVPVVAVLAVLSTLDVSGVRDRLLGGDARIRSIAVLPLVNLSGDAQQDYFADGMTEELTDALARIGSLRVISRTSAMSFKGTKLPLPAIARKLDVGAVIEGTVARQGTRVRITAELVRAHPERHLWGDRYEREVQDVLALQAEVAQAIAQQVRAQVTPEERARLGRGRRVKPEAHEAYLKGRSYLNRLDEKWLQSALDAFQKSTQLDSSYAPAWAGIADTYYELSNIYLPPKEAMPQARAAAARAIRLDPELAEGHTALGVVYAAYDWDWVAAEREYRRSLELNPNHAQTHLYYGQLLHVFGRLDESIAQMQQAVELNPLSTYTRVTATYILFVAGRYSEAIAELKRLEQAEPGYAPIHFNLAQVYEALGRHGEAVSELREAITLGDTPFPRALLGVSLARAGKTREARAILADLERHERESHLSSVAFAMIYTALGDREAAFRRLEKAYNDRDEEMPYLKTDPNLSDLRSDPRFHDLLRRVDLED